MQLICCLTVWHYGERSFVRFRAVAIKPTEYRSSLSLKTVSRLKWHLQLLCACNKQVSIDNFILFYCHHWIRLGHFMRIENDCQYTWDRTLFLIFPEIRCCIVKLQFSFVSRTKQFELLLHISHAFFQMNTIVKYIPFVKKPPLLSYLTLTHCHFEWKKSEERSNADWQHAK